MGGCCGVFHAKLASAVGGRADFRGRSSGDPPHPAQGGSAKIVRFFAAKTAQLRFRELLRRPARKDSLDARLVARIWIGPKGSCNLASCSPPGQTRWPATIQAIFAGRAAHLPTRRPPRRSAREDPADPCGPVRESNRNKAGPLGNLPTPSPFPLGSTEATNSAQQTQKRRPGRHARRTAHT